MTSIIKCFLERGGKMALDGNQKKFIAKKVIELGSKKAVQNHYQKDDAVCQYALKLANKLFKKGE